MGGPSSRTARRSATRRPSKVSQAVGSPLSKPARNHFTRCSRVPWVNASGLTPWPDCCWIRSSPTAAAAFSPSSRSPRLEQVALGVGGVRPDAGEAVRLQLEPNRELVPSSGFSCGREVDVLHHAEQVLDVVADLVRDDVRLREVARRVEPLLQLLHERQIEIDLAVARAVEGADGRRGVAAARLHAVCRRGR